MKALLLTLLSLSPVLRAGVPSGCPAAVELFRAYQARETSAERFALFAPDALIRLHGETPDGQDLGQKELPLSEFRATAGEPGPFRYQGIRCETEGESWVVTAVRSRPGQTEEPVNFRIARRSGLLRIVAASFRKIAD